MKKLKNPLGIIALCLKSDTSQTGTESLDLSSDLEYSIFIHNKTMFDSSDYPWYIINENDSTLFWSNEYGWVDYYTADPFDDYEHKVLNLPIEGKWFCFLDSKNLCSNF